MNVWEKQNRVKDWLIFRRCQTLSSSLLLVSGQEKTAAADKDVGDWAAMTNVRASLYLHPPSRLVFPVPTPICPSLSRGCHGLAGWATFYSVIPPCPRTCAFCTTVTASSPRTFSLEEMGRERETRDANNEGDKECVRERARGNVFALKKLY